MDLHEIRAVIMDVDGTMYDQPKLRRAVLLRLLRTYVAHPERLIRVGRILRSFRQAQEELRGTPCRTSIADEQLAIACRRARVNSEAGRTCVEKWMESEPLELLPRFVYSALIEFLAGCSKRGIRLGVFSDYPAEAKLRAMGVRHFFDVVASAQDPEINVFKPHPRGLLTVARRLGVDPRHALYIGDRADVDACAAQAASMPCFILTEEFSCPFPQLS